MTETSRDVQVRLKALNEMYAAQLPEKLGQLEAAWHRLEKPEWDEEGWTALHRMVHSLTGSGKTFGFSLLSDVAHKLEQTLKQPLQEKCAPEEEQRKLISVLLSELLQVAMHKDAGGTEPVPSQKSSPSKRILVLEQDRTLAEELKVQLGYFGYEVALHDTLVDFCSAVQENEQAVVLMDVAFTETGQSGIMLMKEIQQCLKIPVPVIFLAERDEFETRLEAVRAGGIAYLNKPINIGVLIDKLDSLTTHILPRACRVLIVDDSQALTAFYAAVLVQAGMEVRVVNSPLKVMAPLLEFCPDLILIDIYMPECNGMELARVIRQRDAFLSIPIVFLSAEIDLEKQLYAMGLGADDFLTKPIQPQHLISAISNRTRRSLKLRDSMVRDSLTGLLNHTAIKEQLEHEIAQSRRRGTPLSFAMVDIDHFKRVNDTYGHPVGDKVIKSLSRLLKQRLRATDIVGRYGGEEFAVVLTDADAEAAMRVLDNVRQDFSQLHQLASGAEFQVTFSCGVADLAHYDDAAKLNDAADKALYKAKHAGRNRVMQAD